MRFFRQYSVGPYIVDFYCPKLKLAIELDGGQHARDDNLEYDAARSAYLKAQGIDVMRLRGGERGVIVIKLGLAINFAISYATLSGDYGFYEITEERERIEGTKRKNQYVRRAILLVLHMVYLGMKLQRHSFFS